MVDGSQAIGRVPGVELSGEPLPGRSAQADGQLTITQQAEDGLAQGLGVFRRYEESGLAIGDELRHATHGGSDDGQPQGHGFQHHHGTAFPTG